MKRYAKVRNATLRNLCFHILFLLVFAVLTVFSLYVMRGASFCKTPNSWARR